MSFKLDAQFYLSPKFTRNLTRLSHTCLVCNTSIDWLREAGQDQSQQGWYERNIHTNRDLSGKLAILSLNSVTWPKVQVQFLRKLFSWNMQLKFEGLHGGITMSSRFAGTPCITSLWRVFGSGKSWLLFSEQVETLPIRLKKTSQTFFQTSCPAPS
jgi:hypothetical protein